MDIDKIIKAVNQSDIKILIRTISWIENETPGYN